MSTIRPMNVSSPEHPDDRPAAPVGAVRDSHHAFEHASDAVERLAHVLRSPVQFSVAATHLCSHGGSINAG